MIASFLRFLPMIVLFSMVMLFTILVYLLSNRGESTLSYKTLPNGVRTVTEETTEESTEEEY